MSGANALALGVGSVALVFLVIPILWGIAWEVLQPTEEPEGEDGTFENVEPPIRLPM